MKSVRFLAGLLVILMSLFLLAACRKDKPTGDPSGTSPSDPSVTNTPGAYETDPDATEAPTQSAGTEAPTDGDVTETPTEAPTEEVTTEAPTEEETTEPFVLPEADPDDAASAGLPLDKDDYVFIGESAAHDPKVQYLFMINYPHAYEGKTFTLYGNIMEDEAGNLILSLGDDMEFVIYFKNGKAPTVGSYVKITATYEKTVDRGEYVDFDSYTMMVTACEVLGEAKGPNGGKLMYITASALNVRTSSDTSSSANIIGTLAKGDLVEVFEQDAKGWYRITFNGQTAYISNKYVSETKP